MRFILANFWEFCGVFCFFAILGIPSVLAIAVEETFCKLLVSDAFVLTAVPFSGGLGTGKISFGGFLLGLIGD